MKRLSWFSTTFLSFCFSLGLTIATSPAWIAAQTPPYDEWTAKTIKEMEIVEWDEKGGATSAPNPLVLKMDQEIRPTILHREKAKYTSMAHDHKIQGIVVLGMVFGANEKITGVRIIRDLPYGLTAQALIAMQKIKFKPAVKDGKPVSVRAMLEFSFNLY